MRYGILFIGVCSLWAQTNTFSPLSGLALGELLPQSSSRQSAMGHTGIAWKHPLRMNVTNPAAISALEVTTADITAFYRQLFLQTPSQQSFLPAGGIHHIAFAFPSVKGFALGFGAAPYTTSGYEIEKETTFDDGDNQYPLRLGRLSDGGLTRAYGMLAFRIKKQFHFGVQLAYLFGSLREEWQATLEVQDANYAAGYVALYQFNGIGYRVGALFQDTMKKLLWTIGAIFQGNAFVNVQQEERYYGLIRRINVFGLASTNATIDTLPLSSFTIALPMATGVGFSLEKPTKWYWTIEGLYQPWQTFDFRTRGTTLQPYITLRSGIEWIPNIQSNRYLKRIRYRTGFYAGQHFVQLNQNKVLFWGSTLGVGLPLRKDASMIQIHIEYFQAGSKQKNLLIERNLKIYLGISFNERWFIKRRIG